MHVHIFPFSGYSPALFFPPQASGCQISQKFCWFCAFKNTSISGCERRLGKKQCTFARRCTKHTHTHSKAWNVSQLDAVRNVCVHSLRVTSRDFCFDAKRLAQGRVCVWSMEEQCSRGWCTMQCSKPDPTVETEREKKMHTNQDSQTHIAVEARISTEAYFISCTRLCYYATTAWVTACEYICEYVTEKNVQWAHIYFLINLDFHLPCAMCSFGVVVSGASDKVGCRMLAAFLISFSRCTMHNSI